MEEEPESQETSNIVTQKAGMDSSLTRLIVAIAKRKFKCRSLVIFALPLFGHKISLSWICRRIISFLVPHPSLILSIMAPKTVMRKAAMKGAMKKAAMKSAMKKGAIEKAMKTGKDYDVKIVDGKKVPYQNNETLR